MSKNTIESTGNETKPKFVARTLTDVQRIKLQKLMDNPNKEVNIPTARTKKTDEFGNLSIPSFVRNVMGSSAGAGSGEFHVYRHLRRKEYARQKHIQQKSKQEELDDEFKNRLENHRLASEGKTAKKRAKRLKKKQNAKNRKFNPQSTEEPQTDESSECSENDEKGNDKEIKKGSEDSVENVDNVDKETTTKIDEIDNSLVKATD